MCCLPHFRQGHDPSLTRAALPLPYKTCPPPSPPQYETSIEKVSKSWLKGRGSNVRRLLIPNKAVIAQNHPRNYFSAEQAEREVFQHSSQGDVPLSEALGFLSTPPVLPEDDQYMAVKFYSCTPAMCNSFFFNSGEVRGRCVLPRA